MRSKALVFVLLLLLLPPSEVAFAQPNDRDEDWWYIAAYAGGVSPPDLSSVESNGAKVGRINFKDGYTGGLKLGFVPGKRWTWFNWEFEYWYANPRIKGQTVTVNGVPTGIAGSNVHAHTLAWNFILRRHEGIIQPYIGVGPSLVYVDTNGAQIDDATANFGINLLAGVRLMAWNKVGIFAEVKHNRAEVDMGSFSGDYEPLAGVAGLVIHFDSFPTLIF